MYECMRHAVVDVHRRKEERQSIGPYSAQDSGVSDSPIDEPQLSPSVLRQLRNEFKQAIGELLLELDEGVSTISHLSVLGRNFAFKSRNDRQKNEMLYQILINQEQLELDQQAQIYANQND